MLGYVFFIKNKKESKRFGNYNIWVKKNHIVHSFSDLPAKEGTEYKKYEVLITLSKFGQTFKQIPTQNCMRTQSSV